MRPLVSGEKAIPIGVAFCSISNSRTSKAEKVLSHLQLVGDDFLLALTLECERLPGGLVQYKLHAPEGSLACVRFRVAFDITRVRLTRETAAAGSPHRVYLSTHLSTSEIGCVRDYVRHAFSCGCWKSRARKTYVW